MINLSITKAGKASTTVADVTITIQGNPPYGMDLVTGEAFYKREAHLLANALWDSLPGGTIDQLIEELMRRRAKLFIIPLGGEGLYGNQQTEAQTD